MKKKIIILLTLISVIQVSNAQLNVKLSDGSDAPDLYYNTNNYYFGIGTADPQKKLEVFGDISLPNGSGKKCIYTWTPNDGNWRIGMNTDPGFTRALTSAHVQYMTYYKGTGQGFALGVNGGQSSFEILGSNHQAYFRGSVGINVTAITEKLEINGNAKATSVYSTSGQFNSCASNNLYLQTNGITRMTIKSSNGDVNLDASMYLTKDKIFLIGYGSTASYFRISPNESSKHVYSDYKENIYFRPDGSPWYSTLILEKSGNVGIGFSTSYTPGASHTQGYKLAVNGGILCESVQVIQDVPNSDFVFSPAYNLMSLPEIEAFIAHNRHLPNIPSSEDFKKNGYSVGKMDDMLLRKIEELTLLMIEQNKTIEELKAKIEKLESK